MKLTVDDLEKVLRLTGAEDSSGLRMALAKQLSSIWDQGYTQGQNDAMDQVTFAAGNCPYTQSHTRDWCGSAGCRES